MFVTQGGLRVNGCGPTETKSGVKRGVGAEVVDLEVDA